MCRLYALHANALSRVECGLVRGQNALLAQSHRDRRGLGNPDGWGIALFRNGKLSVERRSAAAFGDLRFSDVATRAEAQTILAHVRKASVGGRAIENTHPFVSDRWAFAHNGTVPAFNRVRPVLESETPPDLRAQRRGNTDSELCFLWLLGRLRRAGVDLERPAEDFAGLLAHLGQIIAALDALCRGFAPSVPPTLNFILTDGTVLAATRWNIPLYWLDRKGEAPCEICETPHSNVDDSGYRALVVASEPICAGAWREVPEHGVIAGAGGELVDCGRPLELDANAPTRERQASATQAGGCCPSDCGFTN